MSMDEDRKTMEMVGEYELHKILVEQLTRSPLDIGGLGDDCAMMEIGRGKFLLLSTDRTAESAYLRSFRYAGQLCAVQNLADIVCKGGTPMALLLALSVPPETSIHDYSELVAGAEEIVRQYGAYIVGGDTKEADRPNVVGCGIGLVTGRKPIRRMGARPGDVIALTLKGSRLIGMPWAFFLVDRYKLDVGSQFKSMVEQRYYEDNLSLPFKETQAAFLTDMIRSGCDASDGIAGAVRLLTEPFGLGANFDFKKIRGVIEPDVVIVAEKLGVEFERFAFSPGFVWENVFCVAPEEFDCVRGSVGAVGGDFVQIGAVTNDPGMTIEIDGERRAVRAIYNEGFKEVRWLARLTENWLHGGLYL